MTTLPYGPEPGQEGDVYLPEKPLKQNAPAILLIHGGGWCAMERSSIAGVAEFLCAEGFTVFNISYRLTTVKPWPACGNDCRKAAEFMLKKGNMPGPEFDRIFVIGASAGGHLALMTGLRLPKERVAGIVSISGITDIAFFRRENPGIYRLFGENTHKTDMDDEASPTHYIRKDQIPVLLTHCIHDSVVSYGNAELFMKKSEKAEAHAELFTYIRPSDGHCIWIPNSSPHKLFPEIESVIGAFFKRLS